MDPGTDLEFTAIFDVYPKVELGDFSSMEIKKPQADIEEADVGGNGREASRSAHDL